ncbi:DHA2 family efflux MFS transporter permease subunit [Nocardia amamiensis]|uniref:DHA2 family efflux MFS transporter permease subunit n=1 Tax=Nocardia amamiensis TaxID=404578 RepID=A0ABS0CJG4_9NOCA|nr:DHA2 family efflux MFS transporter permease subunit [Nocardia amamiensis]MBF6296734.1 DHA2 family efflux MFS transporter permease subunit [Nocardia amamiensis]
MALLVTTPVEPGTIYGRRWAALAVLCLSLLIGVMANTSLIVAAPDMTVDLGLSSQDLQWIIDAYTIPYAALMLLMGAIGDKYSRRGMLLLGLAVFASGAVLGSIVDSADWVIAARAIMGTAAAMIMPATLSLLVATFPKRERATAITIWTATTGLAIAVGPLVAGWLLQDNGWASTFLINVPIAVVSIGAALVLVPPSKADTTQRLDLTGGALSVVAVAALVYMIIEGPRNGWHTSAVIAGILAALATAGFIAWELRHPNPMLDIRKFRDRAFAGANLAVLLFFLAAFGSIYYITQHLQFVLEYDPLATGVRLLPLAGAVFVGSAITGVLTPRLGLRTMVVAGMAVGTLALVILTQVDAQSGYGAFVWPLILLGLAIGLSVSPATDTIMDAFPERLLGVGGAVNDTSVELGGTLGIAILGSLLGTAYTDEIAPLVDGRLPAEAADVAQDSIGGALIVAQRIGEAGMREQAAQLISAADAAFAHAVSHTSLIAAIVLAVGTAAVAALLPARRKPTPAPAPSTTEEVVMVG